MRYLVVLLVLSTALSLCFYPAFALATSGEASEAIARAEEAIASMEDAGFGTAFPRDVLSESKKALEEGDYDKAVKRSGVVVSRMTRALEIRDFLWALDHRIAAAEAKGLDASKVRDTMSAAVVSFSQENYDEAEEFISRASSELDDVEAEYSILSARYDAARSNVMAYSKEHALGIVVSLLLFFILTSVLSISITISATGRKIRDLVFEKEVLKELVERAQTQYYKEASISKSAYEIKTKKFREMAREIDEELPVLNSRLTALKKILPLRSVKTA